MKGHLQRFATRVTVILVTALVAFSLGAVSSARASAGRNATTTLQAILGAVEALASGLRPPSNDQTRLLFPIVSTQGLNSTLLTIVNTGQDPSGTPGHSGNCTIELFGTAATTIGPVAVPIGNVINPALHSGVVPDFLGYAVATCEFPFAHGLYQLTTATGTQLGAALILPPTRSATFVEALGH